MSPVPGATNATFTLTNVSLSDSATYSVLVTNSIGSVLSSNAVLTVLPALVTTQPASGLSATGAVLNGSVTVGVEPWSGLNGARIPITAISRERPSCRATTQATVSALL